LVAVVLPDVPPEPEFAPPAASTVPVVAETLLLPAWPTAVALPVLVVAVPVSVTVLLLVVALVAPEFAPSLAPPVVVLPLPPLFTVVVALVPAADALPVEADALLLTVLVAV
jgi:hypothetical protein